MLKTLNSTLDRFIPDDLRRSDIELPMVRNFVLLHLLGPLMGHAVTTFLWIRIPSPGWQFWLLEAAVASFFLIPVVLCVTRSMQIAAMLSIQLLVGVSLFGSFWFGGISSPLLPWFLIAMVMCFFYLANAIKPALCGIAAQLVAFSAARFITGDFPELVANEALLLPNLLSIMAALTYMTLLCLFYEAVMRISLKLEQETIAQRGRVSSLREAMAEAELGSRRKSIFLAKMSHELRTPLNAVIGYTEMLKETWEDRGVDQRKATDLDRIRGAGRHLLALVNDVIDLSSIEANRVALNNEAVDVASLVQEVISTAEPLARKRDNKVVLNMPEDVGVIELDALKLRQSLLNLLSNAAKFTSKGMIMLTVLREVSAKGDWLSLEVTDNGIGMTREGRERIFRSFSQAEPDTASRYGGSGLGLALTKRFAEMMGGSIGVRSEFGVGSSFTIMIPAVDARLPDVIAA